MSANVSSPANFPKWPFWRVLEFDKFAGEWPLLNFFQICEEATFRLTFKSIFLPLWTKTLSKISFFEFFYQVIVVQIQPGGKTFNSSKISCKQYCL
jgi:hypothetical protein